METTSERFIDGYSTLAAFDAAEQRDVTEGVGVTASKGVSGDGYNEDGSLAVNMVYTRG